MNEYITTQEMKDLEKRAVENGITIEALMENAGRAIAYNAEKEFGVNGKKILAVAGRGNNGGDALVAARWLSGKNVYVTAILLADPEEIKTREAKRNWDILGCAKLAATTKDDIEKLDPYIKDADIIIAGIFGTGINGAIKDPEATAIRLINSSKAKKIAVDVPSGLDPDTGKANDPTIMADITVTMHRAKIGLKGNGRYAGKVIVADIGMG